MKVRHDDHESRRLPVHFGHEREFRPDDVLQHFCFMQKTLARHREEAPVLFPCRVVDLPAAVDFAVEVLEVEIAEREPIVAQRALGVLSISVGQLEHVVARAREVVREQVFRLRESGRVHELRVVTWIQPS
jgi:hypothetical protein